MELLTRKEAATYLRLSLRKLDALSASGNLRRVKFGEGQRARVLFRKKDLDTFIEVHTSRNQDELQREVAEIMGPRP